jgi:hypothetical protein
MSIPNVTWWAQSTNWSRKFDLVGVREVGDHKIEVIMPLEPQMILQRIDRTQLIGEPTLSLEQDSAQSLIQALWDAGLRPREIPESNKEVSALKQHIVFAEHMAKALLPLPTAP